MYLSKKQIEDFKQKILENAIELIEEAEILFNGSKFARAYALAHLAFEELAKIPILADAPARIKYEDDYNWKEFWNEILSHKSKLDFSINFNLEHEQVFLEITDLNDFKLVDVLKKMNNLKNASLYAGKTKGSLKKPSDIISKKISKNMILISKEYYEFIENYERCLRPEYEKVLTEKEVEKLASELNELSPIEVLENNEKVKLR
ncbi:AbiV family abortive infection protein [Priestia megaterium]